MRRIVDVLGKPGRTKRAYSVFVLCAMAALDLSAQTFTTLFSLDVTDGAEPAAGLVQATNGDLYGTTFLGGAGTGSCIFGGLGCGTILQIMPTGTLVALHSFCSLSDCSDGVAPFGGLVQAANGDLYGTTTEGGANGGGTVFKITPSGTLTTLYSFARGSYPSAGLVQAANGDLYGTTSYGGAIAPYGTVFKITPSGSLTTLYSFCSQPGCVDGDLPVAGLIQATNGDFYGTTFDGGANGSYGTIFKITPSGTLTTLYSFCSQPGCTDGAFPYAGLVQGSDGSLYGAAAGGGVDNCPDSLVPPGCGTIFKITPSGELTTLYSFCSQTGCTDGTYPHGGLVQATNGDFYGTTGFGGASGYGTVFKVTPVGSLTTLYSFCSQSNCTDGSVPESSLLQATNGNFYGTTSAGGDEGAGTIFSLSVGLGPFVETQTNSGRVGAAVKILGSDLTGATSVTFNGTPAAFTVASRYSITTTVPSGATTGKVEVVTPSGTLSSNVAFQVLP